MKVTYQIKKSANKNDHDSKGTVYLRVRDGRNMECIVPTNITLNPNMFDSRSGQIKSRVVCDNKVRLKIDKELRDLKTSIEAAYAEEQGPIDKEWVKLHMDMFYHPDKYVRPEKKAKKKELIPMFDHYLEMHPLSEIRIRNNRVVERMMQRYEYFVRLTQIGQKRFKLYLDDVTPETLHELWNFIYNEYKYVTQYPEIYEKYPEKRVPKRRGMNTMSDYFCKIRTFFIWCYKNGYTENRPFDKFHIDEPVYGTPVFITLEERDQLLDKDFSDNPRLDRQRDIFVFQSLIGCRVSDLYAMTRANIVNDAIEYIAEKTVNGQPRTIRVPLIDISRNILKKYEDYEGPDLFPFTVQQEYNEDIKKVFKEAGLTRRVTILNPTTRKQEQHELWEVASSHMARRTFVGNLYKRTKDKGIVSILSGHKSDSRSFDRYWTPDESMRMETAELLERQDKKEEPIKPLHPGLLLQQSFKARHLRVSTMAKEFKVDKLELEEILAGDQPVNEQVANGLEKAFHIPAAMWLTLQQEYDFVRKNQKTE